MDILNGCISFAEDWGRKKTHGSINAYGEAQMNKQHELEHYIKWWRKLAAYEPSPELLKLLNSGQVQAGVPWPLRVWRSTPRPGPG
jgi:hypothetical protein